MLIVGVSDNFVMPGLSGRAGQIYDIITDYAATIVFLCMVIAVVRRLVFKPARYAVPARYGKAHTADAIFLLALIAIMMVADSFFAAAHAAAAGAGRPPPSNRWPSFRWRGYSKRSRFTSLPTLGVSTSGPVCSMKSAFYFLMCYRPFGIQFHVKRPSSMFTSQSWTAGL